MKTFATIILLSASLNSFSQPDAQELIDRVDRNMSSKSRIFESSMTIHGARSSRTVTSRSYTVGDEKSFTEYLSPAREQGTKMLKLEDQLWIYSPSTDRIIQISGHMLRQSVMGSDLSYEDMMEDRKITDVYTPKVSGNEQVEGRRTWIVELTAKVTDIAYAKKKIWIDTERYVPLKEESYAKSGQLLKRASMSEVIQISGRWFPTKIIYKDILKQGNGTEFKITKIEFDKDIPEYIFTKAALKQ